MTQKNNRFTLEMSARPGSAKLHWKAPEILRIEARDGEASFTYGGVDTGIYHS
jgi:hypothetical protein